MDGLHYYNEQRCNKLYMSLEDTINLCNDYMEKI